MTMDKNRLEDIYSLLDEVTLEDNKTSADTTEERLTKEHPNLASIGRTLNQSRIVKKPELAKVESFSSRLDCFEQFLTKVDYGSRNSATYVEGHKDALAKYLAEAKENPKNLFIAEGRVNDEIAKYSRANKASLYVKGYYDGLVYVYKALKFSKQLTADKIYQVLQREIGR